MVESFRHLRSFRKRNSHSAQKKFQMRNFACKLLSFERKFSSMTPDQIKKWLKESGKNRQWLAEKCAVSKSTVDGWLSNRPLPKPAISTILSLMKAEATFNPRLTLDQFAKIQQRAKEEGITMEEWITKAIIGALCIAVVLLASGRGESALAFLASLIS